MKSIEVELRGPVDNNSHKLLMSYVKANGVQTSTQKRVFFDLSKTIGINNRELDVRAKVTNRKIQIVVKKGLAGSPSRDEAELTISDKSLQETLHLLSLLGYGEGVYGVRKIERYQVGDIEFAIQEAVSVIDGTTHSIFYEAEILTDKDNQVEAENNIRKVLAEIGLRIYDRDGWNGYESIINKEANGWFVYGETDISNLSNVV